MLSVANQSIVVRDRELLGLEVLLDTDATTQAMAGCGLSLDSEVRIDYLRYKPGRRCISLVCTINAGREQQFVLSAFPEVEFAKQHFKYSDAVLEGKCWQDTVRRIRIDRFPFDPGLRHVEKCFDESERRRLLRRILGRESHHDQISLETLAYKPGRRYVAAGKVKESPSSPIDSEPLNTLKFYSRSQFNATLQRLQAIQSIDIDSPKVLASHEHYNAVAFEWIHGLLLADMLATQTLDSSLMGEVGRQLARLHNCPAPQTATPAADAHDLRDLAACVGFLCPELKTLAEQIVNETRVQLLQTSYRLTAIHGDFYAKQVLVDEDTVKFIDFDQAGLGDPHQDVGNFVAKLYWQSIHQGRDLSHVRQHADAFLRGYHSHYHGFGAMVYRAHLAAGLIRCATHPFRHAEQDWPSATRQLLMLARNALHHSPIFFDSGAVA